MAGEPLPAAAEAPIATTGEPVQPLGSYVPKVKPDGVGKCVCGIVAALWFGRCIGCLNDEWAALA